VKRILSLCATLCLTTAVAGAQGVSPACQPSSPSDLEGIAASDACQKALDLFAYMAPQFGTTIAGGNATLGQGGPLGGFPHFTVSLRGNILGGSLPQVDQVSVATDGAHSSTYPTKTQILALPQVDAAIGLFRGLPLGITNVGGVDLLLSAAYIPSFHSSGVDVNVPDGSVKLGFGARVGLLQESLLLPGVSFTILRRGLPTVDIHAETADGDTLLVDGVKLNTTSWRLVASKSLVLFGLAAGIGGDRYSSDANISAYVPAQGPLTEPVTAGPIAAHQTLKRTNYFVDLSFNLLMVKFIGEVGGVSGGTVQTYNQFDGKAPDASRLYGSAGLRFGF
jgi:hypothetical protein